MNVCVRAGSFFFWEGIDLGVIHRKVLKVSKLDPALALRSPQRQDIDVLLSNELFRNKSEKKKEEEVCYKGCSPSACQYSGGVEGVLP